MIVKKKNTKKLVINKITKPSYSIYIYINVERSTAKGASC